jgi:S-DNA-T family DNA segregation ATPase FtsK/SpoIIIE
MTSKPAQTDSIVDDLIEGLTEIIATLALLVWRLLFVVAGNPILMIGAAGVWATLHWHGRIPAVAVCAGFVLALLTWRATFPRSFSRAVGLPATASTWGCLVRVRWSHVAARHGLVAHSYAGESGSQVDREVAELGRIKATPGMLRLRVRLPAGLTTADIEGACEGLAHAFRVRECRVVTDRPGFVWLELHRRDLLAAVVSPLPTVEAVDLDRVPVGRHEDGTAWTIAVRGTHLLLAGATGSGKSSVLWSMLRALAGRIRTGSVQVWAVDPKGGMELGPGRALFSRFEETDPERMCQLVEALVDLKDTRAQELASAGRRIHDATPASPHIVLIVDELATLTAFAERKIMSRFDQALGLLLTQGRACGITVVSAVQDPGKDVVGWRDLFPTRIALRLDNPIQVDMVLGDGARDRGARADHINELTPGVAYVRTLGTRQLKRVRSAYLNDTDIGDLVRATSAPLDDVLAELEADLQGGAS